MNARLPNWIPRLSRRQRIGRNLLLAVMMLFLIWVIRGFPAPTMQLAAAWRAATYGLEPPEILYFSDWETDVFTQNDIILGWEDGRMASAAGYRSPGFRKVTGLKFAEPIDGITLLYQNNGWPNALYLHTDIPDAVRASASLRQRAIIQFQAENETDGTLQDFYFDWDETYQMEAAPNKHHIYCFELARKFERDTLQGHAEDKSLLIFGGICQNGLAGPEDAIDLTVTFYDQNGTALRTVERVLWRGANVTEGG